MIMYLMRHGETRLNRELRMQGSSNVHLNEKGRKQAEKARKRIGESDLHFDRVITSPLYRAVETAELATGMDRSCFEIEERIREMDYGPYDGKKILTLDRSVLAFLKAPQKKETPAGIETPESLYERASAFLKECQKDPQPESVLVVTHGIAMRALFGYMKGLDSKEMWNQRLVIENCAIFRTEVSKNGFTEPIKL